MAKRPTPIILDDDDDDDRAIRRELQTKERSRDGFEMGLASAILGATFLILGMLAPLLMMAVSRPRYGDIYSSRDDGFGEVFLVIGLVGSEVMSIIGMVFGKRGISRSRGARSSTAMPLAGLLLCLAAMFIWLVIACFAIAAIS